MASNVPDRGLDIYLMQMSHEPDRGCARLRTRPRALDGNVFLADGSIVMGHGIGYEFVVGFVED